ncbi:MAG: bifunctional DNA-formamidopyrimidine glycosylase/DNA-(apurinic or apyrimidinic site) lyase [Burkholderiaceae bacterium]|nr:bifunctional DNA-formamidopyrimidine glycosylase/DNA-(apurinic or apyrimidinic site) lyase [Burkholderiaceae bacterium]
MPELPEVEVTRIGISDRLCGQSITDVVVRKSLRWPLGVEGRELRGRTIARVLRRGKYIILELDQGILLLHLGMSGRLFLAASDQPFGPHDHFDLVTSAGVLRLCDPRRFGAVVWSASQGVDPARKLLSHLGPEPLDESFDLKGFQRALKARRCSVKTALLGGEMVVGVGNIYASEALFRAHIRPTTPCAAIGLVRSRRLHSAIRDVLQAAIDRGGSTLRDYQDVHGRAGNYQSVAMVYGRAGQTCHRCGGTVAKIVQNNRSTFFCPGCQHV